MQNITDKYISYIQEYLEQRKNSGACLLFFGNKTDYINDLIDFSYLIKESNLHEVS